MTNILTLTFVIFGFVLGGCSSDPEKPTPLPPPQTLIDVQIIVTDQVNKDIDGRPSPIVMKMFELKNIGKFEETDFYKLFDDTTTSLGADLVAEEQLHLHPGDTKTIKKPVSSDTKYVAVTAAYRELNQAIWRGYFPLESAKTNQLKVILDQLSISIEKSKSTNKPSDASEN